MPSTSPRPTALGAAEPARQAAVAAAPAQPSPPAPAPAQALVSTGAPRLDELLEGGLPLGSATLVHGPPFLGRDTLARNFLLAGLRRGVPAILVTTSATAAEVGARLMAQEPRVAEFGRLGLLRVFDCYSQLVGPSDQARGIEHHEITDVAGLANAVGHAVQGRAGRRAGPLLVIDSVSTLLAYNGAREVFQGLHMLLGRARAANATALLLLEPGMHPEADVQMFKHLATGSLEVKNQNAKLLVRVEGNLVFEDRGWVEYRYDDESFDVTGSFSAGRIR